MVTKLVMPKLGLTMKEGMIARWIKEEGDTLKKGDDVLEIETEKLTDILESPVDGTLLRMMGRPGDSLPIAAVLAYIGEPGEPIPEEAAAPDSAQASDSAQAPENAQAPESAQAPDGRGKVRASPAARALAGRIGLDYALLSGTGPGGRIVKRDVEAAAASPQPRAGLPAPPPRSVPYAGMRKAIGSAMSASWSAAPMVTHHARADMTELFALRSRLNEGIEDGGGRIGLLDIFVKIVAKAIGSFPIMGATLSGDEIILPGNVNIGIAVAVEGGLVVPVVRDAGRKDLFAVSREAKGLVAKARGKALAPGDVGGGSFTISSIGGYGSVDFFTPIINQPESAILGICRTQDTPVARDGGIVVRPLIGLSLTFDHRVIDGAPAAEFLALLIRYVENPLRAVFEG
ncbi:MAG: 2-oxo acid dehydrogenase subunit E2 [Clostridiales Family XIII bacterium]|jgi:pyruvate dehydrogenase E2 component (dihydrolipoamide acetyltransferase)|nr:2-oxo acid dehydrogenase subunit E2 [Clostridiales Family XIII bacterium]